LQSSFLKCLPDPDKGVRTQAAIGIGLLTPFAKSPDVLVTSVLTEVKNVSQETSLFAFQQILIHGGSLINPDLLAKSVQNLFSFLESDDEEVRNTAAISVGAYSKFCKNKNFEDLISQLLSFKSPFAKKHAACVALKSIIFHSSSKMQPFQEQVISFLLAFFKDEKVLVRQSACETLGKLVLLQFVADTIPDKIVESFVQLFSDDSSDVKIASLKAIKNLAKQYPYVISKYLDILVPPLMMRVKEKTFPIKLAAERALLYVLQINSNPSILEQYSKKLSELTSKTLNEYVSKVLVKLEVNSEQDEEDEEKIE